MVGGLPIPRWCFRRPGSGWAAIARSTDSGSGRGSRSSSRQEIGSLGERNDVRCVSIEHKMGIHASPTAVLAFGDGGGAIGYLVGEENRGLEYMFIMMNEARFGVGVQGIGIGERAWQQALAFAKERVQGRDAVSGAAGYNVELLDRFTVDDDPHRDIYDLLTLALETLAASEPAGGGELAVQLASSATSVEDSSHGWSCPCTT